MTEKMLGNGDVGVRRREFLRVGLAASLVPFLGCSSSGGGGVEKEGPKSICSIGCSVNPDYENHKVLKPFAEGKILPRDMAAYVINSDSIIAEEFYTTKDGYSVLSAFSAGGNLGEVYWLYPGGGDAIKKKTREGYWKSSSGILGNKYRKESCS